MSLYITAPIAAIGTYAFNAGKNFDSQMSKVEAVSGATGEALEKLRNQAKELGATTVFSASQAAEGMEYLALAGWKTEEILSAMPGMLNLAAAGALDLGRAADITSDVMSAFNLEADKATHTADVFAYAQANANTNVEQMGEAMTYLAPVANALGWELEESAAAIMKLADSGVKGSMAGQAFATSLARLAKPTSAMKKEMNRLGMEFFDAEGNMKSLPEVMAEIEKGTKGMTKEQQSATLSTLFGAQAYKHWAILLESGSDVLAETTEALLNADGAAEKMAETMMDNLGGSIIELKSAIEGAAISIYELAEGSIRTVVDKATEWVGKFIELDDSTKNLIIIIAGVAAALGPVLIAFGMLATAISAIGIPVALAIAGVTALIAAFSAAYLGIDSFREIIDTSMSVISDVVRTTFNFIKDIVMTIIGDATAFIHDKLSYIREFWAENGEMIAQAVENVFGFIKATIEFVMPAVEFIIKTVWASIEKIFSGAIDVILGIIKAFAALFTGDWSKLWEGIKQILSGAFNVLFGLFELNLMGRVMGLLRSFFNLFKGIFTNISSTGINLISNMWNGILNIFNGAVGTVTSATRNIANSISNILGNLGREALQWGKNMINGFIDGIKSMGSAVANAARDTVSRAADYLKFWSPAKKGEGRFITQWGENMIDGFLDGVRKAIPDIEATFSNAIPNMSPILTPSVNGSVPAPITPNYHGGDIIIQNMTVRNDEDIKLISRELHRLQQSRGRGMGDV